MIDERGVEQEGKHTTNKHKMVGERGKIAPAREFLQPCHGLDFVQIQDRSGGTPQN